MRLFTEQVSPTLTSSGHNTLTVQKCEKIFFDTYELDINGESFVAEKVGEFNGHDVLNLPVTIDGDEIFYPFVVKRGKQFKLSFNIENREVPKNLRDSDTENRNFEGFSKYLLFGEHAINSSRHCDFNYIKTFDFSHLFFGTYQLEVDGNTFVVEKTGEFEGNPVVSIPVLIDDVNVVYPFVLQRGEFEISFNEQNKEISGNIVTNHRILDNDNLYLKSRGEIAKELKKIKILEKKHREQLQEKKISELKKFNDLKQDAILEMVEESKGQFYTEIIDLVTNIKREFDKQRTDQSSKLNEKFNKSFEKIYKDISSNFAQFEKNCEKEITNLISALYESKILKDIETRFEILSDIERTKRDELDKLFEEFQINIISENDKRSKLVDQGISKISSKVGNIKVDSAKNIKKLEKDIDDFKKVISESYDEKFKILESFPHFEKEIENLKTLLESNKTHTINNVDYILEKNGDTSLNFDLKKEFEKFKKEQQQRLDTEVGTMRKMVVHYAGGGGTVAVQYANGGVINGDLVINGSLSATNFSGGGGGDGGSSNVAIDYWVLSASDFSDFYKKQLFRYDLNFGTNVVKTFKLQDGATLAQSSFTLLITDNFSKNTLKYDTVVSGYNVEGTGYATLEIGNTLYSSIIPILSAGYLCFEVVMNEPSNMNIIGSSIYQPAMVIVSEDEQIFISENDQIFTP
jgi:hypothetical protein